MLEYQIQRCTRQCAATGRELRPGEPFYSVLLRQDGQIVRRDYSHDAWEGPPPEALAWWHSRMPEPDHRKPTWAPNQVLIEYFEQLVEDADPSQAELTYVLALLLVRRRLLRIADDGAPDATTLTVTCPLNDATYEVPVAVPSRRRFAELEERLARLLFGDQT